MLYFGSLLIIEIIQANNLKLNTSVLVHYVDNQHEVKLIGIATIQFALYWGSVLYPDPVPSIIKQK